MKANSKAFLLLEMLIALATGSIVLCCFVHLQSIIAVQCGHARQKNQALLKIVSHVERIKGRLDMEQEEGVMSNDIQVEQGRSLHSLTPLYMMAWRKILPGSRLQVTQVPLLWVCAYKQEQNNKRDFLTLLTLL
ncbi:MAG: hypothetical protein H6679_04780 [Epsilonproteobacteria bacterium]|nr:hypothetical protein [Campylobacterota bacterium]